MINDLLLEVTNIDAFAAKIISGLPPEGSLPEDDGDLYSLGYFYRLRGIASFLLEADVRRFKELLAKAVQVRLHYMNAVSSQGGKDFELHPNSTTVKNAGFFDALTIRDWDSAARLAAMSAGRWNEEYEYEDDYLFQEACQQLLLRSCGKPDTVEPLFERLQGLVHDTNALQIDLIHSLVTGSRNDFNESLVALAGLRKANFEKKRAVMDLPGFILETEAHLDVLLCGIVNLAAQLGIAKDQEVAQVPDDLMDAMSRVEVSLARNAWRQYP